MTIGDGAALVSNGFRTLAAYAEIARESFRAFSDGSWGLAEFHDVRNPPRSKVPRSNRQPRGQRDYL